MKMRGFVRVTLCAFSFVAGVDCGCGYGRPSVINPRHLGGTDVDKFEGFKANLKMKCGEEFEEQFLAVQQVVVAHKDNKVLSYLFEGKWLENILLQNFLRLLPDNRSTLVTLARCYRVLQLPPSILIRNGAEALSHGWRHFFQPMRQERGDSF
jgi:hypothetical protein